ncbi:MAG: chemotaxis response regulator protein-glutamate methylesterase [Methylococcales bacterium]|nr:chemotaxis response regulator protein-glutamate methylesterase [Methylococcales bacterium]
MQKIRLLVIDDSALIRKILTEIFNSAPDMEVVGVAEDPIVARDLIKKLNPDVLTLDVEMPRMDGLTFLRNLMRLRPMPVVMISTLTEKGAEVTLEALKIGAVDFIAKPKVDVANSLNDYAQILIEKVRMAARARVKGEGLSVSGISAPKAYAPSITVDTENNSVDVILAPVTVKKAFKKTEKIIALGASTGGTEAIKAVMRDLPKSTPAIVISQHLPAAFSVSFARHVNDVSAMTVVIAKEGQPVLPGHIYIAPGDKHLLVMREGMQYICRLNDGAAVNRHKPSVDVMFRSIAQQVGSNAIGVMLTGMGADGARSMKEMHDVGAKNIVQDEASSVVWGMPGEVYKLGAADYVVPLDGIAKLIIKLATQ